MFQVQIPRNGQLNADVATFEFKLFEVCLGFGISDGGGFGFPRPSGRGGVEHYVPLRGRTSERFREQRLRRFDDKVIIIGHLGVDGDLR